VYLTSLVRVLLGEFFFQFEGRHRSATKLAKEIIEVAAKCVEKCLQI